MIRTTWEYKVRLGPHVKNTDVESLLCQYGADGWELVVMEPRGWVFKRPRDKAAEEAAEFLAERAKEALLRGER